MGLYESSASSAGDDTMAATTLQKLVCDYTGVDTKAVVKHNVVCMSRAGIAPSIIGIPNERGVSNSSHPCFVRGGSQTPRVDLDRFISSETHLQNISAFHV